MPIKKDKDFQQLTKQEISWVFGKSQTTIGEWVKAGMPKTNLGKYNTADCIAWLVEQAKRKMGEQFEGEDSVKYLAEYRRERALLAKRDREKFEGRLVDRDEVASTWRQLVSEARAAFLYLPRRLAPVLAPMFEPRDIEAELKSEIYKILEKLARPIKKRAKSGK